MFDVSGRHSGRLAAHAGSQRFEHRGWLVEAGTGPISKDAEIDALRQRLDTAAMPEQLFGDSYLRLTHSSGTAVEFNAADALAAWKEEGLPPVQVGHASKWQNERRDALSKVATLKHDWTFTTPYAGSLRLCNDSATAASGTSSAAAGYWQASATGPDLALLTARDPILFYADVPLYESELDDNGTAQLTVKVRVMPNCWYVLLRFFLRVDRMFVRLREARLFCDLRQPTRLVRELKHSEAALTALSGGSARGRGVAHADAESAALALSAIAPDGVKLFRTESMQLSAKAVSEHVQAPE